MVNEKEILLIDKDLAWCLLMKDCFNEIGWSKFSFTSEPVEAINELASLKHKGQLPALIILDLHFARSGTHEMSELEILKQIKEVCYNILIITHSRTDSHEFLKAAGKMGVRAHAKKATLYSENKEFARWVLSFLR